MISDSVEACSQEYAVTLLLENVDLCDGDPDFEFTTGPRQLSGTTPSERAQGFDWSVLARIALGERGAASY